MQMYRENNANIFLLLFQGAQMNRFLLNTKIPMTEINCLKRSEGASFALNCIIFITPFYAVTDTGDAEYSMNIPPRVSAAWSNIAVPT